MPRRAPTPCRKPGCAGLCHDRSGYCVDHRVLKSNWRRDGNTTQRGYGAAWRKLRDRILKRDNYTCQECKRNGLLTALIIGYRNHPRSANVDHIVAKARGGTDDEYNLEALCKTCHDKKTARERAA